LLFLPAYSAELQPAEHLWSLTNTVQANQHFASIEELEDAQAARCVALQARPDLIRSTTRFSWWPQRIRTVHHIDLRRQPRVLRPGRVAEPPAGGGTRYVSRRVPCGTLPVCLGTLVRRGQRFAPHLPTPNSAAFPAVLVAG